MLQSISPLNPVLQRAPWISPSKDEHILQAFYRFYLIASDSHTAQSFGGRNFFNIALDGDCAVADQADKGHDGGFQPPSLGAISRFCCRVEDALARDSSNLIALRVPFQHHAVSTAVFLVGSYMLFSIGLPIIDVEARFAPFAPLLAALREGWAHGNPNAMCVQCSISDCWGGLSKALQLGWIASPSEVAAAAAAADSDELDPFRQDIQELVPGKLVVFRGPRALPDGAPWRDVVTGDGRPVGREFSPAHLAPALRRLGAVVVVRLNAPDYPAGDFPAAGLAFADLHVPKDGPPPPAVVAKFLRLLDAAPGAVALHSLASRGRAGTLAALYAMRRHGFGAREAAGWLRAVRPGSVAPAQLEYLAGREAVLRRVADAGGDAEAGGASPISRVALMLGRGAAATVARSASAGAAAPFLYTGTEGAAASESDNDNRSRGRNITVLARALRIVGDVMAEVDARLLALERPPDSPRPPASPVRALAAAAAASAACVDLATPWSRRPGSCSSLGDEVCRGGGSRPRRGDPSLIPRRLQWQSCPSLM